MIDPDDLARRLRSARPRPGDPDFQGIVVVSHATVRRRSVLAQFIEIDPQVVTAADGHVHIVAWWGRLTSAPAWATTSILDGLVEIGFPGDRFGRGVVQRLEIKDPGTGDERLVAWTYGVEDPPWIRDSAGGEPAGDREPCLPYPPTITGSIRLERPN